MTQPRRVLEVFHGMDCGGAENMIMNLYRNIDRSRIQMDFLVHTPNPCFFDEEIKALGGRIYRVPYFSGTNIIKYRKALETFFSSHQEIDVVHGHLGSCANIYLGIAKKHGCYTIAHSHNTKPKFSLKNLIYRMNTFRVRRTADYFIGCSEAAGRYRFGNYIVDKSGHYSTMNNAIKTDNFIYNPDVRQRIREQYDLKDEIVIGHIGRFNQQKNHDYLIDIFNCYSRINPSSRLFLVGDGALRERIQGKVTNLGLDEKVCFTGLKKNANEYLQAFDCFVFPSFYEGLPVTVIEAQASGLPCIISDKITREVSVTNLVRYLSIDSDPQKWVDTIVSEIESNKRVNRKTEIVDSGYDINATTKWLTDLYLSYDRKN